MAMLPKIVTILSAPRSGSSMLSSMIASLGVQFGNAEELVSASKYNRYGFFEKTEVLEINETILREVSDGMVGSILTHLGVSEEERRFIVSNNYWCASNRPVDGSAKLHENLENRMVEAVNKFKSSSAPIAWKDARFSLTLPVWSKYMEPVPIIVWRHPAQVARSIESMTNIPYEYALWLWAYYTRASFEITTEVKPFIIKHSELLDQPGYVMEKLIDYLGHKQIKVESNIEEAKDKIDNREVNQEQTDLPKEVSILNLYNWLLDGAVGQPPQLPDPPYSKELPVIIGALGNLYNLYQREHYRYQRQCSRNKELVSDIRKIPAYRYLIKVGDILSRSRIGKYKDL